MEKAELKELIEEFDENYDCEGAIYATPDDYYDIVNEIMIDDDRWIGSVNKYRGFKIFQDTLINKTQILPLNNADLEDFFLSDPPQKLIENMIEIQESFRKDIYEEIDLYDFTTYLFFKPFCKWQRFYDDKIEKWGHPSENQNVRIKNGEDNEFSKLSFDYNDRIKIGFQKSISKEMKESKTNEERFLHEVEKNFYKRIHKIIKSVNKKYIYAERERTFKGAYPILDIEHKEDILFGYYCENYQSLFMLNVETDVKKLKLNHI